MTFAGLGLSNGKHYRQHREAAMPVKTGKKRKSAELDESGSAASPANAPNGLACEYIAEPLRSKAGA